jgi:glycerol-3-phosphate dehydrogenase (NAD(P)+)
MKKKLNIVIVGSGAIGTALGNSLAKKKDFEIKLLSIENEVVNSINNQHINHKYFPRIVLEENLYATMDINILADADIIFLGIPSAHTPKYVNKHMHLLKEDAIIVNLAKGFADDKRTIGEGLKKMLSQRVCAMKGPTFARELINNQPTAFTVASKHAEVFDIFENLFEGTNIYADYTKDLKGVELISLLKNIYAIVIGIVDAQFDSPNLRSLVLTNCYKEMQAMLVQFGGKKDTMRKYCGIGDFTLTALNDLSRNRTLGLLIGKGFFSQSISDKVVLEGQVATQVFCEKISQTHELTDYNIINELYKVFNEDYDVSSFVNKIITYKYD